MAIHLGKVEAKTKRLGELQEQINKLVAERDKLMGQPCDEKDDDANYAPAEATTEAPAAAPYVVPESPPSS